MNPRKIFVLLAILGCGVASQALYEVREDIDIGPSGCRVLTGHFKGRSFAFEADETREVAGETAISVENAFGDVHVRSGAAGAVHVKLRKVVYLPTEAEARTFASSVHLNAVLSGGTLRLGTNRNELDRHVGLETHLEIEVPSGSTLKVRNEHGEVSAHDVGGADLETSYDQLSLEHASGAATLVNRHGRVEASGVKGALVLNVRYGDVEVKDVSGKAELTAEHGDVRATNVGALRADLRYGELKTEGIHGGLELNAEHAPLRAEGVEGDAVVTTSYADVHVKDVGGEARLKTTHGEVEAENVKGPARVETGYAGIALTGIGGQATVKVAHGGVTAKDLHGGAQIEASGDEISLDGFAGAVEIDAQRAAVHLVPGGPVSQPIRVRTTNGGIHLEVPDGSRFQLAASVRSGELEVSLPGFTVTESARDHVAGNIGGGGNLVTLATDHGDVQVSKRDNVAEK